MEMGSVDGLVISLSSDVVRYDVIAALNSANLRHAPPAVHDPSTTPEALWRQAIPPHYPPSRATAI